MGRHIYRPNKAGSTGRRVRNNCLAALCLADDIGRFFGAIVSRGLLHSSRERWHDWINSPFMYWLVIAMPFVFYVWYFALARGILGATNTSISGLVLACLFVTAVLVALRRVRDKRRRLVFGIAFVVMLILLPQIGDQFQNTVLNKIAIFSVVGIGLNIVLGYAGMLHLGYIAFLPSVHMLMVCSHRLIRIL